MTYHICPSNHSIQEVKPGGSEIQSLLSYTMSSKANMVMMMDDDDDDG